MKTETREIYRCDFCSKIYLRHNAAITHESRCTKNPANWRPCHSCTHLTKKTVDVYNRPYYGEGMWRLDLLYCPKIKSFLFTPQTESKGGGFELENDNNIVMPITCEIFEKESIELEDLFGEMFE